jgi:Flp pilus assembly pilin Flp
MKSFQKKLATFWKDQRGIERLEYALVAALITLCAVAAIGFLSGPGLK